MGQRLVASLVRKKGQFLSHGALRLQLEAVQDPRPLGEQLHPAGLPVGPDLEKIAHKFES